MCYWLDGNGSDIEMKKSFITIFKRLKYDR